MPYCVMQVGNVVGCLLVVPGQVSAVIWSSVVRLNAHFLNP